MTGAAHIVLIHWTMPPAVGGSESHVADVAAALAAAGRQVTVITGEQHALPVPGCRTISVDTLRFDRLWHHRGASSELEDELYAELGIVLAALSPDVVHAHNLHQIRPEPARALARLRADLRLVVHHTFHCHALWPAGAALDPGVFTAWDANYVLSAFVHTELARLDMPTTLLPSGVDVGRFRSRRPCLRAAAPPVLLHPARLVPEKGADVSLAALRALRADGVAAKLIIADGPTPDWDDVIGPYRHGLAAAVARWGLAEAVEFRRLPYRDMPGAYEEADIVLYPVRWDEPLGLVPLEAMSARRPVVASRCGGITGTVRHTSTGYLVPPGDWRAVARRIRWLLRHPDEARRTARRAHREVRATHDLTVHVADLLRRYDLTCRTAAG
ncbi:glycosyltransferase family 4 protein [Catellatospora bangladeshensis]|uniref:Glycosyl transferase n=1 Tax=Catellatospora bangladeshensis TaxID=310355 RepID=A0A8J3JKC7_9ACTN|nr:glycosyltransferase family 4 protein [Catellatospora bangladeshensis]GIF82012.1 glycosyl transferase [Catellatospora bangladeshensis]